MFLPFLCAVRSISREFKQFLKVMFTSSMTVEEGFLSSSHSHSGSPTPNSNYHIGSAKNKITKKPIILQVLPQVYNFQYVKTGTFHCFSPPLSSQFTVQQYSFTEAIKGYKMIQRCMLKLACWNKCTFTKRCSLLHEMMICKKHNFMYQLSHIPAKACQKL